MASESELIKIAKEGFDIIEKHFVKRVGKPTPPQRARLPQAYTPRKHYFPAKGPEPNNRYVYHPQESLVVYQHAAAEEAPVITGHDAAMLAGDNNLRRNPMRTTY